MDTVGDKNERDQAVLSAMKNFKFDRSMAEFYVAISRGEVKGDIIDLAVDEDYSEDDED